MSSLSNNEFSSLTENSNLMFEWWNRGVVTNDIYYVDSPEREDVESLLEIAQDYDVIIHVGSK